LNVAKILTWCENKHIVQIFKHFGFTLFQVTGCALRKLDADGNISQTVFSTQNEPPLPPRKRAKKYSSKTKTNSVVALEQHFEQIRRKHAEFNW
jgi:hypothetical protein